MSIHNIPPATFLGGATQTPPSIAGRQQNNQVVKTLCTCVRDVLLACIIALICIALISIISSLIIRPRTPRFTVISAAVAGINATGTELKAACNLSMLANNPNTNLVIWYRQIDAFLLYGSDYELTQTQITPMFQSKRNQTVISAQFVSDDVDVENDIVEGVVSELKRGVVTFGVRIRAVVRFKRGKWLTRTFFVKADCDGLDIGLLNGTVTGDLIEPGRQCEGVCKTRSWIAALKLAVFAMLPFAYY